MGDKAEDKAEDKRVSLVAEPEAEWERKVEELF